MTSSSEPWRFAAPYLAGGNRVGASQQGRPPVQGLYDQAYDTAQVSNADAYQFGPQSQQARQALWNQTQAPTGLEQAARGQLGDTLAGDYLYGGPGFNAAYQAASNRIIPQVSSMFSGGGRLNSGLAQGTMAANLGDAFAGLYNNERARQMQASALMPEMDQAKWARMNVPLQLGSSADEMARMRAFEPQQRIGWYGGILGGSPMQSSASQPGQSSSMLGNILGLGSLGFGAWNMFRADPTSAMGNLF